MKKETNEDDGDSDSAACGNYRCDHFNSGIPSFQNGRERSKRRNI